MYAKLTMYAKLGILPALVDDHDHDKKEGAGEYGQAHSNRYLCRNAHTHGRVRITDMKYRWKTLEVEAITYHKRATLLVLRDVDD